MTNSCPFRETVKNLGLKYKAIAKKLNLSTYGLQKKIDNISEFKASEIMILSDVMHLSEKQRSDIFFYHEK